MTIPNLTLEQRTAFAELLASKDQDVLKEMLSLVYDAAIKAQFNQHIGAEPHERSDDRRDVRNGSRTRGLNTRAGSPRVRMIWYQHLLKKRLKAILPGAYHDRDIKQRIAIV